MKQHALGRIDSQALEQLRVAKRKLDHFAKGVDGIAHPAEIVVGYIGPAIALPAEIFGEQLDVGLGVDVDDSLGKRRYDLEAHFLKGEGRCVQHLPDGIGNIGIDPLMPGGRDRVAFGQRASGKGALERSRGALQPHIVLGGSEDDLGGGFRAGFADLDKIARTDARVGSRKAVEPNDIEAFVVPIGTDRPGRGGALADDFDGVAFVEAEIFHQLCRQPGDAPAAVAGGQVRDLHAHRSRPFSHVGVRHRISSLPARALETKRRRTRRVQFGTFAIG